jgi:hypothetical protein
MNIKNNFKSHCTHDTHRSRLVSGAVAGLMSLFLFCGGCTMKEFYDNLSFSKETPKDSELSKPEPKSEGATDACVEERSFRVEPTDPNDEPRKECKPEVTVTE